MKKLISVLLVIASLMQLTFVSAESTAADLSDNTISKLLYLDMISIETPYEQADLVSRGEFPKYLFKYLGKSVPAATASYFYDVPKTHEYVHGINYMVDCGYIQKDASGLYLPDDNLTVKDAAMVMLNVMGYGPVANAVGYEALIGNAYSGLVSGVNSQNGFITVGGLMEMFENALDVRMFSLSGEVKNGSPLYKSDDTFMNGYFKVYEGKGRINATCLTSLDEAISLYGNYVAVDSVVYKVPDSMTNIVNYLGYNVKIYYKENKDNELEIVYFEDNNTDELIIKADDFISYSDRRIKYIKDDSGSIKTATIENGASIIYNGHIINKYTADIFEIEQGTIELVGKSGSYDVVKIYDYKDIVIGGVSLSDNLIYSKYSTDIYDLEDYDEVVMRDCYGRDISVGDIKSEMVASVGESSDGEVLIINVSAEKVTGVLNGVSSDFDDTVWTIDGKEYEFSNDYSYPVRPVGANVTVYLNYQGRISYVVAGTTSNMMYGYLVKAYIDDDADLLMVKVFTEQGTHETFKVSGKLKIDSQICSGGEAISMLSYENPSSLAPTDSVQPQLIKYKINSSAEITSIDTARTVNSENGDTALVKNITNMHSQYFSSVKRIVSIADENVGKYSNSCLITDKTKVFAVPGVVDEAKTELDAYKVSGSSYFVNEKQYYVDAYDMDYYNGGAAGVVVVRLESAIKIGELDNAHCLVTGMHQALTGDDEVVNVYEICNLNTGAKLSIYDNSKRRPMETQQIKKGDIIRYGTADDGSVTNCSLIVDPENNLTVGRTESSKSAGNWHGYQFASYNRIIIAQMVDMSDKFLFCSVNANSESTMKDCPFIFDVTSTKCYVVDRNASNGKIQEVDAARLREFTYGNNSNVKVVLFTAMTELKSIVVYV